MARIACISDTHLTSEDRDSKSLFPRQIDSLSEDQAEALYQALRLAIEDAYGAILSWLANQQWDLLIHFGDMTGGYQEQGLGDARIFPHAVRCKRDMEQISPRPRVCLGNHDLGYKHVGSLQGGGISDLSAHKAVELFGDLYWHEVIEGRHIIGVCSSFAEYHGDVPYLLQQKEAQEQFVRDVLRRSSGEPWILCAHDPHTFGELWRVLHPHLASFEQFLYGDLHNPFWGKMKRVQGLFPPPTRKGYTQSVGLVRSSMCPSTAPLWWEGYGCMTVELGRQLAVHQVKLPTPDRIKNLPTASLLTCALWMAKRR